MTMWISRFITTSALAALLLSTAAYSCCTDIEAREALRSGNFSLAASTATTESTIEARLIAAEALSAKVLLGMADDSKDIAKEARALSASVLAETPDNTEAQFQYALADGFVTRETSPFKAWRKKLPQKTKTVVDALIVSSPGDARAHALLGAWHIGILRKAGEKNGAKWFDADLAVGQAAYEKALTLQPDDVVIQSSYALSLAELDFESNGNHARDMLVNAAAAPPKDAIDREVQTRIIEILTLWADEDAAIKRIGQYLDGDG